MHKIITQNRRASFDYHIHETEEAGVALLGTEVKSLRQGSATLQDAFVDFSDGQAFLMQTHIAPYAPAKIANHPPYRPRKLLLHRRQIEKWMGQVTRRGMHVIVMDIHETTRGLMKVRIGLGARKNQVDKRQAIAQKDWKRQKKTLDLE